MLNEMKKLKIAIVVIMITWLVSSWCHAFEFNRPELSITSDLIAAPLDSMDLAQDLVKAYLNSTTNQAALGKQGTNNAAHLKVRVNLERKDSADIIKEFNADLIGCALVERKRGWGEAMDHILSHWGSSGPSPVIIAYRRLHPDSTEFSQPIYLLVREAAAPQWEGFTKFVLSDAGQAVVAKHSDLMPVPYKDRQ